MSEIRSMTSSDAAGERKGKWSRSRTSVSQRRPAELIKGVAMLG